MIKILIVDDEAPIREWLVFCINKLEGFEIVGAASHGAEGYSLFKKHLPHIVITDIRMPIMDGLEMIKMIQGVKPDLYTIVLTSHDDFEYARNALKLGAAEYILKTEITQPNIAELLEKYKSGIVESETNESEIHYEKAAKRSNFLKSLVLKKEEVFTNLATLAEHDIHLKNEAVFAIDIYLEHSKRPTGNKVTLPKLNDVSNIVKLYLDFDHLIIIGNIQGFRSRKDQQTKCVEYANIIIDKYPCRIGISDIFDDTMDLKKAMLQAHNRVKLGFYKDEKKIFTHQDKIVTRPSNGERLKSEFNKALSEKDFNDINAIKSQLMKEIEHESPTDIEYIKKLYVSIMTSIIQLLYEDINTVEEDTSRVYNDIMHSSTFGDLSKIVENIFESFKKKYSKAQKNYSHVITKALDYINQNYASSITLSDVANDVCLSPEYLSRLFKNELGINFIVYLNNKRLEKAVSMLENTTLKVYEVAEKAGYSNLSYFSTVFKKNFGINPFDYRNKRSS